MKIPFEKTIATSYRFAFRNILSIIGIGWAPALAIFAVTAGLVLWQLPGIQDLIAQGHKPDPQQLEVLVPKFLMATFVWVLLFLLASAMIYAGVIRKALGILPGPVYFYFPLDSQVWRIVGAYLLVMVLSWGVLLVFGVILAVVAIIVGNASGAGAGVLIGIFVVLGALAGYYALIRLQFFLPVVVVAENHISLSRSWALGRDNFWRILGITLIMFIPIWFANTMITNVIGQIFVKPFSPDTPPAQMGADMLNALGAMWPYLLVVELFYIVFVLAFIAIAGTAAYRFVTGGESIAPPSPTKA
jgi:hypothetical protein